MLFAFELFLDNSLLSMSSLLSRIEKLNEIGIALSAEKDVQRLLENILLGAKELANADGGTLYLLDEAGESLGFEIISNTSLSIAMSGASAEAITFPAIPLYVDGEPNYSTVVTSCIIKDCTINISDTYQSDEYDFSGARQFDENTGYRTQSLLTIPLKNHENDIIGVMQLINHLDSETGEVNEFSATEVQLTESLASQAAVALTQKRLLDELKKLFESFIQLIATAIDDKSPYTGGHCRRVPELTLMIADAVHDNQVGPLRDFTMSEEDRHELEIAGWLHDCGKVTTPEYVVDKATKLETICDRIHLVESRFEIIKRDLEIAALKEKIRLLGGEAVTAPILNAGQTEQLNNDLSFVKNANIGGEYMSEEDMQRIRSIALARWTDMHGEEKPLLSENEVDNLTIRAGTLLPEEREIINYHIVATVKMLEALPFPKHLQRVPEFAGGHHERMDGKGYPKGLTRDQMSVQARVMAVADIFEALTAADRPYKDGKKLSECLRIMAKMVKNNHIDPDIYDIFIREKVYLKYAEAFVDPAQIDDVSEVLGSGCDLATS